MLDLNSLNETTRTVFEQLAEQDFLQPYTLIGGTALAMQLAHRQSEDLDFCIWNTPSNKIPLAIPADALLLRLNQIAKHLDTLTILPNQLDVVFNGVKLTFFADNENKPIDGAIGFNKNIRVAHRDAIAAMKIGVMFNRQTFRDYYDLYAIAQSGLSLEKMIDAALRFKPYLNAKLIMLRLTYPELQKQEDIGYLNPRYAVSVQTISEFFKSAFRQLKARESE
jgi:predicted nucleotidyltransferase component of viral defense system